MRDRVRDQAIARRRRAPRSRRRQLDREFGGVDPIEALVRAA
jgi:hypothetical protein